MTETVVDVSQDWETACDVQQRFMHHPILAPEGVSYAARCRQLRALGGDCYDFLPLPGNRLAFAIGDASGKSLPAALMIANVQSSLRTAALFAGENPATVLRAVNAQLHTASLTDHFATLFYGVFDPATRILRYANAGHHPPIILRRSGAPDSLEVADLPLGLFRDTAYEPSSVRLRPGDIVIAYTDGVVEAVNAAGAEWGIDGLRQAAIQSIAQPAALHPEDLVDALFASLDAFSEGRLSDDATLAVLLPH